MQALRGVSLDVGEGEIVAVLGANGAGKTTTLRAISGTVRRSGEISLGGARLRGGPEAAARAGIAHVPEGRGTFTELSVTENLRLGAYTRRGRAASRPTSSGWASGSRGSPSAATRRAGTLSGGEQQMLALGRALMSRPRLLLLDEPSLGLAPLVVAEIFRIVRELNERDGLTRARGRAERAHRARRRATAPRSSRSAASPSRAPPTSCAPTSPSAAATSGTRRMADFLQQVVSGLASGGIYASLALALVLIHRATGIINFAQGEMAMFTTYIAWTLTANHGWPYWPAFVVTLAGRVRRRHRASTGSSSGRSSAARC